MAPVSEFSESAVSFSPSQKHTMKIPALLFVASWAAVSCSAATAADTAAPVNSELSRAAAAQLERLAPFRRSGLDDGHASSNKSPRQAASPAPKKSSEPAEQQFQIPIDFVELFRIFSEPSGAQGDVNRDRRSDIQLTPEKMSKLDKYADKIMQDERVQSYMQERIKRDGYGGGYGGGGGSGGSGAFVSGLAGQLVGGVVGLSSTASRGSSSSSGHNTAPVYGPPTYHSYGKENFNIWDFKKAILNTLIQAVKAVGGGVLALKGQLIKGGGFLVSTKGRIISSAGDAITGLGKSLASSAVVNPPPSANSGYGQVGYAYEAPAIVSDAHYDGPPPSPDAYHSFGAASDDDDTQPGLLIAKPVPSVEIHSEHLQTDHLSTENHSVDHPHNENYPTSHEQIEDLDPRNPANAVKNVVSHLTGTSAGYPTNNLKPLESHSAEEPTSIPGNTLQLQDYNQENYDLYLPLGNGPSDGDKTPQLPPKYESPAVDFKNPDSYPQKYEYSTVNYKPPYGLPTKYGSPHVDFQSHNYLPPRPHLESHRTPDIQIEISNHDITGFETGGYSQYKRHPAGLHVVAMQGPLKIPILGQNVPGYYKTHGFPPAHMNSIAGVGKYPRYGPGFEIQPSIGYEIRGRRDGPKIHRT